MKTLRGLYLVFWVLYNYSGIKYIVELAQFKRTNDADYEKPPALALWVIGIYTALYGIASNNYEAALDRAENRMSAVATQLSTSDEQAFKNLIAQIPRIQEIETPVEPSLLWPFEGNFVLASFFVKEQNPEIVGWTQETIEAWKDTLSGVDLGEVDLFWARLSGADLSNAVLVWADLSEAMLRRANLSGAKLWKTDLSGAELEKANLSEAEFLRADLSGADLSSANFSGAHLQGADFSGAYLEGANLSGARLGGVYGDIRGWKDINSIWNANIFGVRDPPKGFREWALENGAVEMEPAGWTAFRSECEGGSLE